MQGTLYNCIYHHDGTAETLAALIRGSRLDPDAKIKDGDTGEYKTALFVLSLVSSVKNCGQAIVLLDAGADPLCFHPGLAFQTPLFRAINERNLAIVRRMLFSEKATDIESATNTSEWGTVWTLKEAVEHADKRQVELGGPAGFGACFVKTLRDAQRLHELNGQVQKILKEGVGRENLASLYKIMAAIYEKHESYERRGFDDEGALLPYHNKYPGDGRFNPEKYRLTLAEDYCKKKENLLREASLCLSVDDCMPCVGEGRLSAADDDVTVRAASAASCSAAEGSASSVEESHVGEESGPLLPASGAIGAAFFGIATGVRRRPVANLISGALGR